MLDWNKRGLLFMLLCAAFFLSANAYSKDDESGGGNSGSGGGSENSGSGGGDEDSDDDDEAENDDEGENDRNRHSRDHERARNAVKKGKVVSLKQLQQHLSTNYPGKLLRVELKRKSGTYYYKVRILTKGNRIRALSLNALTLKAGAS
jgi:hypothetical protein